MDLRPDSLSPDGFLRTHTSLTSLIPLLAPAFIHHSPPFFSFFFSLRRKSLFGVSVFEKNLRQPQLLLSLFSTFFFPPSFPSFFPGVQWYSGVAFISRYFPVSLPPRPFSFLLPSFFFIPRRNLPPPVGQNCSLVFRSIFRFFSL